MCLKYHIILFSALLLEFVVPDSYDVQATIPAVRIFPQRDQSTKQICSTYNAGWERMVVFDGKRISIAPIGWSQRIDSEQFQFHRYTTTSRLG